MKNLMKPLLVIAVLVGLGVIGPVMDRRSSVVALRADGGPSVTIGSPLPLPVTATVTQPIQVEQAIGAGHLTGLSGIFVLYVVPAKKRLVVEHFSSDVGVAPTTPVTGTSLPLPTIRMTQDQQALPILLRLHSVPPTAPFASLAW